MRVRRESGSGYLWVGDMHLEEGSWTISDLAYNYFYDNAGNLIMVDEDNVSPIRYIYAGNRLLATENNGNLYFYHLDRIGSPIMITNKTGNVVKEKTYEAFGNLKWSSGTYSDNREFTGKEKDPTGFHYFGARYYSGDIGRFLSPDPALLLPSGLKLANPQNLNSYIYCVNNPLRYIDPDGREIILIGDNHAFDLYYLIKWLMNDGSSTRTDANRLSYDKSGNLAINKAGYTRGSNKALDWLIDIDDSETKIGFAVGLNPITESDLRKDGSGAVSNLGIVPTCPYHWLKGMTVATPGGNSFTYPILNTDAGSLPPAGFDGTVSISNEVYWMSKGESYNRLGQIVGHEMVEIFLRSHGEGMSYPAAHAIVQEKHYPTPELTAYPHNAP